MYDVTCLYVLLRLLQANRAMEKYLVEEWAQVEADLMKERGLWGPPVGSELDKFQLDMTEGQTTVLSMACDLIAQAFVYCLVTDIHVYKIDSENKGRLQ